MQDNSSANKRIAKNSLFLTIRMVIVLGITLYTTRVLLKILGIEDYGVYNVVGGFVSMFAFLNTSMSNGIQRFFNYELGKNGIEGANRVYCTAVLIQLILAIVIVILTESFGLWYLHNKMNIPDNRMIAAEWIFQLSILSFIFIIMQAPYTAAVMAHERMDFYAIVNVFDAVLKLGIVFFLPYLRVDQLIMYGILMACISAINLTVYYIYSKRCFAEIRLRNFFSREQFLSMLSFSGWNLFGSFSSVMKEQGINLVLNFFFGPIVNAARGVAAQVNSGMQSFVTNITIPVRPQVIQSYACGDLARSMSLTYSISKLSCCFLLMMAIPASLEIDYILSIWLGNNVPAHVSLFTIIILGTSIINNLNSATSGIVHATGIMKDYQLWGSLVSISSVPIAYLLLTYYKIPELALISVLVCAMLGHSVCLFVVRNLVGLSLKDYFRKVVLPILLVFFLSLVLTWFVQMSFTKGFLRFCVVLFAGILSVSIFMYFLAFDIRERKLFVQIVNSIAIKLHL